MIWLYFSLLFFAVIFFGWKLSTYADKLADAKGWSKGIVGFLLLGFATSLPELITTLSSVLLLDNPGLGGGNIIGSNNANMFILYISLLMPVTLMKKGRIDRENMISMALFFVALSVFFIGTVLEGQPKVFGRSIYDFIILFIFIKSIFVLNKTSREDRETNDEVVRKGEITVLFYIFLVINLVALVAISYQLSVVVDEISKVTGWNSTSVGALFLAWATSLPELVVTVSAIILGSSEMGIGNIIGSNIFNLMVLSIANLFAKGENMVYKKDDKLIFLTAILFLLSSTLLYIMSQRMMRKIFRISLLPAIMILVYLVGMITVF